MAERSVCVCEMYGWVDGWIGGWRLEKFVTRPDLTDLGVAVGPKKERDLKRETKRDRD